MKRSSIPASRLSSTRLAALLAGALLSGAVAASADGTLLTSEWKFDTSSVGTTPDSVGGFTGTLANGAAIVAGGKIGSRVDLDGGNDRVTVADTAAHRPATFSVSIWVNAAAADNFDGLWDKIQSSLGVQLLLGVNDDAGLILDTSAILYSGVDVADGAWHLVTGVIESGVGTRIYVDVNVSGANRPPRASNAVTSYSPTATPLAMGGDGVSSLALTGSLDDSAVWNVALKDGEVAALYNAADNGTLNYDAGQADQLFTVHRAGSGSTTIGARTWYYTSGLTGGLGDVVPSGSYFSIKLDNSGTGLTTAIPEPASLALLGLGATMMLKRKR